MKLGLVWCVITLACSSSAEKWRWPESAGAASLRIDTKIGFVDSDAKTKKPAHEHRQDDEVSFQEPLDTDGFYNRPPGAGRFPVRVEAHRPQPFRVDSRGVYPVNPNNQIQDGTLDSLQYCKCVNTPECHPNPNSEAACGNGRYLCCYKQKTQHQQQLQNTEFFNEVEDERPMLLPGRENLARPFPPPPDVAQHGFFSQSGHLPGNSIQPPVLVGPEGPTGVVGPPAKPNVLVGPGGPTGIIGPNKDDSRHSETAQRGVLVGPGGPTGIIGPAGGSGVYGGYGRRPVLVGPGGPTGIIGPGNRGGRGPGVLVGPGGPTGIIGPSFNRGRDPYVSGGRPILVGPGGPTGLIGPQGFFGK
ncbi:uncharacterized protein LOC142976048 [Anticarsia gemmatalis]|uniref:uncharacterized protein LOC142976048 n=1 Tax=Anticarsia gemmatalis TaxID=129554 RepID=UPI003F757EB6